MNLFQEKEQLKLLRFIQILDKRIQSLEDEVQLQKQALASQASALRSLENQKTMMAKEKGLLQFHPGGDEWLHVSDCAYYEDLPQPSTLRQWIRHGKLEEGVDFKRVGVRKKIFVNPTKIVKKTQSGVTYGPRL
jgi:hypothetical protein